MKAGDIMTKEVLTVGPFAKIDMAIRIMVVSRVSGVPVISSGGKLVGILTQGDLLRRVETGTSDCHRPGFLELLVGHRHAAEEYVRTHSRRVDDLMTRKVVTVADETLLEEVVRLMEKHRIRRVPVVQGGRLTGIVSRADLVTALGRKLAEIPMLGGSDQEIEAQIYTKFHDMSCLENSRVTLQVQAGVVTLHGTIHDPQARGALRVAAETVSGVVSVEDRVVFKEPLIASFGPNP
ncbi:CBS domain-containing protein [Acidisoma sp. L85]|uniref:CBS domain-containing protein n=1 Tax=Acidisoma sp. L85 TaxID=1641850 RepID=UPI00131DB3DE|nr:CBS domain-containing protein [Acidisoma sp. L85]